MLGVFVTAIVAMWLGGVAPAFAAYNHAGDTDSPNFRAAYPASVGSKLDSCALCHSGGSYVSSGKTVIDGSCMWCHYTSNYTAANVTTATLNAYGTAYLNGGRTQGALTAIAQADSDGDGYTNAVEIAAGTYPGDASDNPSSIPASARVYTLAEIEALPQHSQFMLMNGTKSTDYYATYTGVTMTDLLANAKILSSANRITVTSPDGFQQYFPLQPGTSTVAGVYPVNFTYPDEYYYYNTQADTALNPSQGWCNYSAPGCAGLVAGSPINVVGGQKMLLAYQYNGSRLTTGYLDLTNTIQGEGPFRVVPPQLFNGAPDQSKTATNQAVVWPYSSSADHNAGYSPRVATMIEVDPMPAGTAAVNSLEAGWPYVDSDSIVVYGAIDPVPTVRSNIAALQTYMAGLASGVWTNSPARSTFAAQVAALDGQVAGGGAEGVMGEVSSTLLPQCDGVVTSGTPDANDCITDPATQRTVYYRLRGINTLLRSSDPKASAVTINAGASSTKRGSKVVLSGVLTPGAVGDSVVVEVSKPGSGRWSYSSKRLAYAMSGAAGGAWYYGYVFTPKATRGTYSFRVRFEATALRSASMSRTIRVAVR